MLLGRRLLPIVQRRLQRQYKVMAPYAASSSYPTDTVKETVDIMASNLDKALAATSHDFRSDTVTGSLLYPSSNRSPDSSDAAKHVYYSNFHRRHLQP